MAIFSEILSVLVWVYAITPVFALLFLLKILYAVAFHPLKNIPGPLGAKLFSSYLSLADLKGRRAQTLAQLHDKYGPLVRIGPNKVTISDWKVYRDIYGAPKASTKDPGFYGAAKFTGIDNLFSMRNHAQHTARRRLMAWPFSSQAITAQEPVISAKAELLLNRLISDTQAQGAANAYELASLFSFEIICSLAFKKEYPAAATDECLRLVKAMDGSAPLLVIDSSMPFIGASGLGQNFPGPIGNAYRSKAFWDKESEIMVDDMISMNEDKSAYFLGPAVNGVDGFLGRFAGSGTTSTTLVYLLYALSRDRGQGIQEKLRKELQENASNLQTLRGLPFLNAVIKETFRLYPTIISTLPRIMDTELCVGNYVIPPKTQVGMQNYVHHRDPTLFPEPDEFIPDRWLKDSKDMDSAITPFSVGACNCIGQNLAWAELYLATSQIFRFSKTVLAPTMTEDDMEMEDRFNIAPKSRKLDLEVNSI